MIVGIIVVVALAVAFFVMYNGLIKKRNAVDTAKSDIGVELQRRADLLPNLLETVKGYAKHESELFEKVADARASAQRLSGNSSIHDMEKVAEQTNALRANFSAVAENYPDLKASENFKELQEQLTTTENKVAYARDLYNSRVNTYNNASQTIPTNIIAGMFASKFGARDLFVVSDEKVNDVPVISFD